MSGRRGGRASRPRTPSDGLADTNGGGPQPSRRSSRQRVPTSKAVSESSNTSARPTALPVVGSDVTTQSRTRGSVAVANGGNKPEEKKPAAVSSQSTVASKKGDSSGGTMQKKLPHLQQKGSQSHGEMDETSRSLIEDATSWLQQLDPEAHNEHILMDADIVLKRLILPMSLPWSHKSTLAVRNMPRDIDELPGILSMGQASDGTTLCGNEHSKQRNEGNTREVLTVSRSTDPGVVELKRRMEPPPAFQSCEEWETPVDPTTVGKLKLASFRDTLKAKRRRLDMAESDPTVTQISFRFGTASSRSSIFPKPQTDGKRPLLLSATFSEDFQRGKRVLIDKANEVARELGSYDYRFGLPRVPLSSNRVRAGRGRLIWSSKHVGGHRPTYRSLLTGMTLEGGSHKRPVTVTVGVRVNGKLLACKTTPAEGGEDNGPSFTEEDVEKALSIAFDQNGLQNGDKQKELPALLSSIDTSVLRARLADYVPRELQHARKAYSIQIGSDTSDTLDIQPPAIECIPTEDGLVRTLCSSPGTMVCTGQKGAATLLSAMSSRSMACAVCWSGDISNEDIYVCANCDIRVHISCHPGDREESTQPDQTWKCNMCKEGPTRSRVDADGQSQEKKRTANNYQCQLCPVSGGVLSRFPSGWCHDVCHAWSASRGGFGEEGQCSLCSKEEGLVVRCAAKGCSVMFHPMCGVVASKAALLARAQRNAPDTVIARSEACELEAKENDALACMQYSLVSTRVRRQDSSAEPNDDGYLVRLGFCGIHNENQRITEFYGLYPRASLYGECIRAPPLRRGEKFVEWETE